MRSGVFVNKRGQFFLMAAVILSVFLFGLAFTVNEVVASERDYGFYDYADGVEREANYVLDYQVYSGVPVENLTEFLSALEADFRGREISGNFLFIYGNSTMMRVKNLGASGIEVGGYDLDGASSVVESKIRVAGVGNVIADHFNSDNEIELTNLGTENDLEIVFNEQVYKFPVSDVNQIIFMIQKDVGDETYVEIR